MRPTLSRPSRRWCLPFLLLLLAGLHCGAASENPFAPGVLHRIECDIETYFQGTVKKVIVLEPNAPLTITGSVFPNGQSFAAEPLLTGTLTFNFPPNTPARDSSVGFQPAMEASVAFDGNWTKSGQFSYGAARVLLTSPGFGTCPTPPRVNTGPPISMGSHPVSITASCNQIRGLSGLGGNDPMEIEEGVYCLLDIIAGDGGVNNGPIFLGVGARVSCRGIYKARRRGQISLPPTTFSFTFTDGQPVPPPKTIVLTNSGGLPLTWAATAVTLPAGGSWIKLSTDKGTLDSRGEVPIDVTIDPTGLAPADYSGTVTIAGDGYGGSKSFTVKLKVVGTPKLTVTPASMEFFNRVAFPEQELTLKNEGSAPLIWQATATSDGNWISTRPGSDPYQPA